MWTYIVLGIISGYLIKKFFNGTFTNLRKSMEGKIIVVTGSSAGIGKVAAFQLLDDGATVIFACRDKKKTEGVLEEYAKTAKSKEYIKNAHYFKLDLTSFDDVFKFVEEFKKKFSRIDVLMNNAGLFPTDFFLTKDGLEGTFQANHLSHMLLSFLLLDHFDGKEGKIINLASLSHNFSDYTEESIFEHQKFENFEDYEPKYFGSVLAKNTLYGNTKLGNIYFTQYLANYLEKNYPHIKTASLHPGGVNTEFTRFVSDYKILSLLHFLVTPLVYLFTKTPLAGAQTQLHLTYMDFKSLINGAYYKDCRLAKISSKASNELIRAAFIEYSWKLIKKFVPQDKLQQHKILS